MNGQLVAKKNWTDFLAPILVFMTVISGLEIIITKLEVPRWILASPSSTFIIFFEEFGSKIFPNFLVTVETIFLGYLISIPLGTIVAIMLNQFRVINKAFTPYILVIISTPMLVLVPLLYMWFGIGMGTRVIAVALQSFTILNLNASVGFSTVDPLKLELMQSLGARRWQRLKYVIIPSSLPNIFNGMRMSSISATTAALGAEFAGSTEGLGAGIVYASNYIQTELMFAYIAMVAIVGILLYLLPTLIEKIVIRWKI